MRDGIACPRCGSTASSVKDSRVTAAGTQRRRRSCVGCGYRYTTHEMLIDKKLVESLSVIKGQCGRTSIELAKLDRIIDEAIKASPGFRRRPVESK